MGFNHKHKVLNEIMSALTHGIGLGLSIAALVVLIIISSDSGSTLQIISFIIFGVSLILLYSSSTLYHALKLTRFGSFWRKIDHSAIFLLIAGSYTPFVLNTLSNGKAWIVFSIMWALALLGIIFKLTSIHKLGKTSVGFYVAMGWMVLFFIKDLATQLSLISLIFLAIGGLAYTSGVIFYAARRIPLNHSIWHLFVLCGSIFHFFAVILI